MRADYDAVIVDVAPSIGLFQACAMMYTQFVVVPVGMEMLSVQGALASINAADSLNHFFHKDKPVIRTIGTLPVMVDRRMQMTTTIMEALEGIAESIGSNPAVDPDRQQCGQGGPWQAVSAGLRSEVASPRGLQDAG